MSELATISTSEGRARLTEELQSLGTTEIEDLSAKEIKEHIHTAIHLVLMDRGTIGYTIEETAFYVKMRYKTLTKDKTNGFIQTQVKNVEKTSPMVTTTISRLFNRDQKKFVGRLK
jgi:hypothetical protein